MHVALIRRNCSLKKAGAERYCVNLFRGLQKLGHQVTVIGEEIDSELREEVNFLPVTVHKLTSWNRNRAFSENCLRVVKQHSFDIVHGLSRVEGLDTYRLTDPMQRHWVNVWYRHPISRWLQQMNPRHRAIFELERRLYQKSGVRRVIVQSKLDAQLLKTYFGVDDSRIRRIVNGVDTSVFHPGARAERARMRQELFPQFGMVAKDGADRRTTTVDLESPLIVFASMDFRRKGLDSLLIALSRLENQEVRLLILGAGDIARYCKQAASLGVLDRVHFAGRQSSIQRFYAMGDLFVLPTVYEPFPNVNLEAMACGTPVITTATAGGADVIVPGENGFIIPDAWAIDDLSEKIDHYFALPASVHQRMSDRCWQIASQLRVEDNARHVAEVFNEVLIEKNAA